MEIGNKNMKKARISQLNKELKKEERTTEPKPSNIEANAPRGERSNFLKVTITLPIEMLEALRNIGMEKKRRGEKDSDVSSLIREAVAAALSGDRWKC